MKGDLASASTSMPTPAARRPEDWLLGCEYVPLHVLIWPRRMSLSMRALKERRNQDPASERYPSRSLSARNLSSNSTAMAGPLACFSLIGLLAVKLLGTVTSTSFGARGSFGGCRWVFRCRLSQTILSLPSCPELARLRMTHCASSFLSNRLRKS